MKKSDFFDRDSSCYFFDHEEAIAHYCKKNFPDEVQHILRVADEVCESFFIFDLKWDMERTYEPVIFQDKIDWTYMPDNDQEFIWQFNRHRFFICLGQAYQITKNEKYAKTFTRLLMDWIKNIPLKKENKSGPWRTLEVGLRGEYWNKAIHYFKDSEYLTDDIIEAFYYSMLEHANYLVANHSPYRYISNWGVIENHGLFEIALMLPKNEKTDEYIRFALKNLEIESRMGILSDGVWWEQSPMYHNEVMHCYFDIIILAKRNNIDLPKTMVSQVKKMVYANVAWKKPDHHQLIMGDSDDTDIRDLISVGAYLFKDPVFKSAGYKKLDFESIWDLGIEAAKEYEKLGSKEPDFTSIGLMESGNYYMRSNWSEEGNFLHFHCGTLGAGHGHSDKLHFDLCINGEDVLMDSGRYTYVSGPDRFEFKDPTGHNTITVDNRLFTVCKDSWECTKLSQPVKQPMVIKDRYEFVQGGHLGYMDMEKGVFMNRKMIHIKPDVYIIVDEMYTGDKHNYNQYFHFNNKGCVTQKEHKISYTGKKARADMYLLTDEIQIELIKGRISRHYNKREENVNVKTSIKGNGFTSAITVIHGGRKENLDAIHIEKVPVKSVLKEITYPSYMAEGLTIQIRNKTYVVVVCHQEVNSPTDLVEVDGCMGYGNVIVFDKEEENLVGEVLNW